jgi:predicted ribosome quality control (RQC) complex YloA/Tae2 family protein
MLSLVELRRAGRILKSRLFDARLHRVVQADEFRLYLAFRTASEGHSILMSCRPEFARVSSTFDIPEPPPVPPSFGQYLRAHVVKSRVADVRVSEHDRQLSVVFSDRDAAAFTLMLSMMGARSNTYLLDADAKLVHAMRPLEDTRRELELGGPWRDPDQQVREEGSDRWTDLPDEEYLEAIEDAYRQLEVARRIETLSRQIDTALGREQAFLERKAVHLQEDLIESRRAAEYRRNGELLKSVLHEIEPGADSVSAVDFESGETVKIPIDPAISPSENLERYFGKYQKELRGTAAIETQLESVQSSLRKVEELRQAARNVQGSDDAAVAELETIATNPSVRRLMARYYPAARKPEPVEKKSKPAFARDVPSRLLPKRYRTEQGFEIWVGRSDEGNDYLTTRLARGNDLFFHLEGYPGSHVILRTEGRTNPPSEAVIDACELAVHYSKMKNASRADVHIAHIKDVKKPKGTKPGLVYVLKGKTIHLRRNPKRLESILASRLDE